MKKSFYLVFLLVALSIGLHSSDDDAGQSPEKNSSLTDRPPFQGSKKVRTPAQQEALESANRRADKWMERDEGRTEREREREERVAREQGRKPIRNK